MSLLRDQTTQQRIPVPTTNLLRDQRSLSYANTLVLARTTVLNTAILQMKKKSGPGRGEQRSNYTLTSRRPQRLAAERVARVRVRRARGESASASLAAPLVDPRPLLVVRVFVFLLSSTGGSQPPQKEVGHVRGDGARELIEARVLKRAEIKD